MNRRFPVPAAKLPQAGGRALVEFDGYSIALFNVGGRFYALDDSCPHQGASLCGGRLDARTVQCAAHGLRFDLESGYLVNSRQLKIATYPVELIDGQAYIIIVSEESLS